MNEIGALKRGRDAICGDGYVEDGKCALVSDQFKYVLADNGQI